MVVVQTIISIKFPLKKGVKLMKQKIVPHFFLKGIRLNRKPNNFGVL